MLYINKKNMKKILVSVFAIAIISLSATAQEKTTQQASRETMQKEHRKAGKHHRKDMMKDMNLNQDQKNQLKANNQDYRTKVQSLNQEQNITVKEANERKAALLKEHKAKNETVFTAEQKNKMAESKLKQEAASKARSEKKLGAMKMKLGLSDDQVSKLKLQQEKNQAEMKAIRENEKIDQATKKQQMMVLKNRAKDQRNSILTPEQIKKMEESKNNKGGKRSK